MLKYTNLAIFLFAYILIELNSKFGFGMLSLCYSGLTRSTKSFARNPANRNILSMKLQTGIVGLPNVGKSTLFNGVDFKFYLFLPNKNM